MKRKIKGLIVAAMLLMIILDTKTAVLGMKSGIQLCLETAIPSLLPFLILSKYLSGALGAIKLPLLSSISKGCGIPAEMGSILWVGLLGGYPVGAQRVSEAYLQKMIDKNTAERLLGFCNNAGPAFIFGISNTIFNRFGIGWTILLIQLCACILTGFLLPGKQKKETHVYQSTEITLIQCVENSVRSMAMICCWIMCFKTILVYIELYLSISNVIFSSVVSAVLELSNGCISLSALDSDAQKFVLMNGMLSFGGICVWMQTQAVSNGLSLKIFTAGKIMQCTISVAISLIVQRLFFSNEPMRNVAIGVAICTVVVVAELLFLNRKIIVASWKKVLYNPFKKYEKRDTYAVSQAD